MAWLWSWFAVVSSLPSVGLLRSVRCQDAPAVAQRALTLPVRTCPDCNWPPLLGSATRQSSYGMTVTCLQQGINIALNLTPIEDLSHEIVLALERRQVLLGGLAPFRSDFVTRRGRRENPSGPNA
jgi:hypothetical protein